MSKPSVKYEIVKFLEKQGGFTFGGKVEDYIREMLGAKASNASRRCRELVEEGILEKKEVQINGIGPHVVCYKIKAKEVFLSTRRPKQLAF